MTESSRVTKTFAAGETIFEEGAEEEGRVVQLRGLVRMKREKAPDAAHGLQHLGERGPWAPSSRGRG